MATTTNGWPVLETSRTTGPLPRLRKWVLPDTPGVPNEHRHLFMRDGSTGFLLMHFALWFHERIERLDVAVWDDWGWAVRPVRGQTSGFSNHAGGVAMDLNATRHPMGVPTSRTFTAREQAAIRRRLRLYRGLIIWGGGWSRPDGMHFELARTPLAPVERRARFLMRFGRGRRVIKANPGARHVINQ